LALISAEDYFKKRGLDIKKNSDEYLRLVMHLRIKKAFTNLKQRTNVCINNLICLKLHFENFFIEELNTDLEYIYAQDLRPFLALKDFPFLDYYIPMQEIIKQFRGEKFFSGFLRDETIDLSPE